jgi:cellulose synthase/poly-beta-1,6-N-acetylglucosamine synthase-like glycosyltransferase
VILDYQPERSGKMSAMNRGVQRAGSEFLIFTDANAMWLPETLPNLMSNFAQAQVGCVSGRKILTGKGTLAEANENLYWRYESWIKSQESRLGSTVAASGELLAVRREVYKFPSLGVINDDSQLVLETVDQGYRVLYDPTAVTFEAGSASMADEFGRKSRIAAGRWQLSGKLLSLAPDHPGFVLKYVSHKLLRLLVMPLMILAFLSNLAVIMAQPAAGTGFEALIRLSPPWGQLFMAGQVSLYLLAALGAVLDQLGIRFKPVYFIYFFVAAQCATFIGLLRFSSGRQTVIWRKAAH